MALVMENQTRENHSLSIANISDEPLDLSLRNTPHHRERERENSDGPIKRQKVIAKLWQTREVLRPQEFLQWIGSGSMSDAKETQRSAMKADPIVAITPEALPKSIQLNDNNREKDLGRKDLVSGDSSRAPQPPKKRKRFTITELYVMEKVFEVKMFVTSREIQEMARLLDIEFYRIKHWFQARRQKWKKENLRRKEDGVHVAAFARL
ncbi:hypothetical protein GHT06_020725 [Daphnia sinensis]|uniref:Homeobox domain-containing protein n=1 Tax=Daphnia sinensis TaxID=1820382 RepID=A0AAD5L879_9CRUS|nr:hypothetical protein GHT06_020725 [Daphnia sinensis]